MMALISRVFNNLLDLAIEFIYIIGDTAVTMSVLAYGYSSLMLYNGTLLNASGLHVTLFSYCCCAACWMIYRLVFNRDYICSALSITFILGTYYNLKYIR
jgi:hypothetical protein